MASAGDLLEPSVPAAHDWWTKVWRSGAVSVLLVSERSVWRADVEALLEGEGYAVRVDPQGDAVLDPRCPYDIAVVDLAITRRSPSDVLTALRTRTTIPILAISPDRYREPALLEAYAAGADQLVPLNARSRELMARVRALLRRCPPRPRGTVTVGEDVGPLTLDLAASVVTVAGVAVDLARREGEVLSVLMQRPGYVVTRAQLNDGDRSKHAERALDALVRGLRSKLEAVEGRRRIVAVRGVGFRLVPDSER